MNTDVMGVFYYVNDFYYKYDKTVSSSFFAPSPPPVKNKPT